jgi:hypothetical protein
VIRQMVLPVSSATYRAPMQTAAGRPQTVPSGLAHFLLRERCVRENGIAGRVLVVHLLPFFCAKYSNYAS